MTNPRRVMDGLRASARGIYASEAAAELLIRAFHGRFASPDWLWIHEGNRVGHYWLDPESLLAYSGGLSAGERRVLSVVAALASSGSLTDMGDVLTGVDRGNLHLILTAFAHAGGSHDQVEVTITHDGYSTTRLPALLAWPSVVEEAA